MVLAAPDSMAIHDHVMTKVYILTKEEGGFNKPLLHRMRCTLYTMTADIKFALDLLDKEMVLPGEDVQVRVRVSLANNTHYHHGKLIRNDQSRLLMILTPQIPKKMVLQKGQRFTIRALGHTVGTGVVTEVMPDMTMKELLEYKKGYTRKEREAILEKHKDIISSYGKDPEIK